MPQVGVAECLPIRSALKSSPAHESPELPSPPPADRSRTDLRLLAGVVVGLAVVVSFYRLGDGRTLTSHEAFVAVTTREMLVSGDWLVPRFGGVLRLTKPPLAYWMAGLASLPFGDVTEFTSRLPSAISGLVLVAVVGVWADRWYGRAAGLCAALVQATSLWHTLHAREATVDMLQCLLMTLAMFLAAHQPNGESGWRRRGRWLLIYLLLGVLSLAKFQFGPILVLAPIIAFWCIERQPREFLNLLSPVGILAGGVIAFAWPWFMVQQVPAALEVWRHETLGRALGEMRPEPVWYFVPLLLYLMLPWTVLYPAMIRESWVRGRGPDGSRERFLWTWIVVQFLLLSLSSNKHKNYIVPALPALAILLGPALESAWTWLTIHRRPKLSLTAAAIVLAIAGGTATACIASAKWPHLRIPLIGLGILIGMGGSTCAVVMHLRRWRIAGLTAAALFVGIHMTVVGQIIPGRDYRLPVVEFAEAARKSEPEADFRVYGMGQSAVVYYLGLPVHRIEDWPELVARSREEQECPPIVTFRWLLPGFVDHYDVEVLDSVRKNHPAFARQTDDVVLVRLSPKWRPATQAAAGPRDGQVTR